MAGDIRTTIVNRKTSSDNRRARARDLMLHATLLAVVLWGCVAADLISPGPYGRFSRLQKGNDFVQFYVLARLIKSGDFGALTDDARFREAQRPYLAPAASASYPAVYGPQVAMAMSPLASLPYLLALACWIALTIGGTAWAVRRLWRACPALSEWWRTVLVVSAAFPPVAYLVLAGQLSVVSLAALTLSVAALARGSKSLAGCALGILGYKYSLFVPALIGCALAGEGTIVALAALTGVAPLIAAIPIVGLDVVAAFIGNTLAVSRAPDALAAAPALMFSLRTFWSELLPRNAAIVAYLLSAFVTWLVTARGWRRTSDPLRRVGILAISIGLTSPHLFLYDLVILIPALMASAGILVAHRAPALKVATVLAFVGPCVSPAIASFTQVQLATAVMAVWLLTLARPDVASSAELASTG